MAGNALYDVGLRLRAASPHVVQLGRASIAALLGIPEETVRKWLDIYRSAGIEVLAMMGKKHAAYSFETCLLYTSPSPRDRQKSRMPSSA